MAVGCLVALGFYFGGEARMRRGGARVIVASSPTPASLRLNSASRPQKTSSGPPDPLRYRRHAYSPGGAGVKAFAKVFETEFGAVDGFEKLKFAGRTDMSLGHASFFVTTISRTHRKILSASSRNTSSGWTILSRNQ